MVSLTTVTVKSIGYPSAMKSADGVFSRRSQRIKHKRFCGISDIFRTRCFLQLTQNNAGEVLQESPKSEEDYVFLIKRKLFK